MTLTDLHTHLLPNIDDGSRSIVQSVEVLRDFRADGVQAVVLTPHIRAGEIAEAGEAHLRRRDAALEELSGRTPPEPRLYLGFEIMLDEPLPSLVTGDRRFSLVGSRYYLVEFPLGVVAEFTTRVLERIAAAGVVPLVAHAERYDACSVEMVQAWRGVGAKIQVDATTLARPTTRGRRARALLTAGLADLLASDNHGDGRSVRTGARFLREQTEAAAAETVANLLTVENPKAVIEDREMSDVPPIRFSDGLVARLRRVLRT
jgi:protein-tyrosine phosphatase